MPPSSEETRLLDSSTRPLDPICGFETEYALNCEIDGASANDKLEQAVAITAMRLTACQFQENSSRIYLDIGNHPEFSTGEGKSFLGESHSMLAGHVTMARRHKQAEEKLNNKLKGKLSVKLTANTSDPLGNSWSSHGNVLAPRHLDPFDYIGALAAHNLSRIVWSGAGLVVKDRDSSGFRYYLSEKAEHIWELASSSTTISRPLVNLRDEPLADVGRFRRVHDTAGETIFSPHANALRLATTSIILKACTLGVSFDSLALENPISAIRQISHDPSLKRTVALANGRQYSAISLQRALHEKSLNAGLAADYLTDQEKYWAEKWVTILDDLETDPLSCIKRVDWVLKQRLIERELDAKHKSGTKLTDFEIAWSKSIEYHRLLPNEGAGMRMLRAGFYEDSPSTEELDYGLSLPPTRAALRGDALRRLRIAGVDYKADWQNIVCDGRSGRVLLKDPYCTTDERLEKLLGKVAA
jgi:proteasome accessory factor A